jgi:hypothetical protein
MKFIKPYIESFLASDHHYLNQYLTNIGKELGVDLLDNNMIQIESNNPVYEKLPTFLRLNKYKNTNQYVNVGYRYPNQELNFEWHLNEYGSAFLYLKLDGQDRGRMIVDMWEGAKNEKEFYKLLMKHYKLSKRVKPEPDPELSLEAISEYPDVDWLFLKNLNNAYDINVIDTDMTLEYDEETNDYWIEFPNNYLRIAYSKDQQMLRIWKTDPTVPFKESGDISEVDVHNKEAEFILLELRTLYRYYSKMEKDPDLTFESTFITAIGEDDYLPIGTEIVCAKNKYMKNTKIRCFTAGKVYVVTESGEEDSSRVEVIDDLGKRHTLGEWIFDFDYAEEDPEINI